MKKFIISRYSLLSISTAALLIAISLTHPVFAAVPDGYVVKVDSSTLYLDWGKSSGAKPGDRFTVYREGEALKHPVTGEVLGHAQRTLGSGSLQTVEDKFSI